MLCQFSFKNFKSYRDETVFDLQATNENEFKEGLITLEKASSSLLPVSVIYGPNGGGKSSLLEALSALISIVVFPLVNASKNREEIVVIEKRDAIPFLFDATSKEEPTEFSVFFRSEGYEYHYYLAVKRDVVCSETLSRVKIGAKKPSRIFTREYDEVKLGSSLKGNINTNVYSKMPFLTFLAMNYEIDSISIAIRWFESSIVYRNTFPFDSRIYGLLNEKYKNKVVKLINGMDIDISDFRFDGESRTLFLARNIGGEVYELPYSYEAEGTRKLITFLPMALIALEEGRLFIADELDTKLHPKLLRYIIFLFKNKKINSKGAQLLFTSHDMATMKNNVFRRDEIWFAALDSNHSSQIYSLYDIRDEKNGKISKASAYDKQYLEGRYGADPYLQNLIGDSWK